MKEINPNLYPPGGYFFSEGDGTKITGTSWTNVEKKVTMYRANKGVPAGDVHLDVMQQACARSPGLCHEKAAPFSARPPSLKTRVYGWLASRSRDQRMNTLDHVGDREAEARAEICAKCPQRRPVGIGCTACSSSLAALRKSVLDGRKLIRPDLGACEPLGVDLVCAVRLSEAPIESGNLPANCWRKKKG